MNTPTTTNTTTKEASPSPQLCVLETEQHATRLRQVLQYIAWMLHVPPPTVTEDTSFSCSSCRFVQEMEIPNHQPLLLLRHQHTPYFFSETTATAAAGTLTKNHPTTGGPPPRTTTSGRSSFTNNTNINNESPRDFHHCQYASFATETVVILNSHWYS